MKYHEIKLIARQLRSSPTPSEVLLWSYIRKKQLAGRKFLRQHPVIYESKNNHHWFYIPDFYCKKEMLIIELDGPIHEREIDRDKKRDEILSSNGFKVLRIRNEELKNIEGVLKKIAKEFK